MLQTLKIKNVALIDSALLNFDNGLNVISGETGAGKSIMLDSLSFVFGGRADRTLIRENENTMQVEAIFTNIPKIVKEFVISNLALPCEDEIFISRSLDVNGKNICKLNGELIPVASLKKLCSMLVDLHGQSEHLSILNNEYQLKIVDLYSKSSEKKLEILAGLIDQIKLIDQQIKVFGGSNTEKQNLIDLYTYQLNEITNANIMPNEYDELVQEKRTMQQFEKINEALTGANVAISKNLYASSAVEQLAEAKKLLQNITNLNKSFETLYERVNSAYIEVEDIADSINESLRNNTFDEERFNYVDNRLDFIKNLFRKYGGDEQKLFEYQLNISQKLDDLINGEEKRKELMIKREKVLAEILAVQNDISKIRKDSAQKLVSAMQQELKTLGMPNARMDVEFGKTVEEYTYLGNDKVEFLFSSNLGFELKPLNKVVSGGEMSRVMLAYKIVVAGVDSISTILFDEIDSGLSGNIAGTVAEYMARLSKNKQIIAISHLPQICAMADCNIKVEKFSDKSTTRTKINKLSLDGQYEEIARLMGVKMNESGEKVAKELKQLSNDYKQNLNC